ncbi:MAG: heme-degrading domain-containing protein [Verrucomicrobia bacterium]|nr:heme-degrading domain-containing protein [Verrucomicrobiota bacterium]
MAVTDDLETIARQERELVLPHFDPDVAWQLGARLRELASSRRHPVAIEVRRIGQQLFYTALTGATPDNADWIRRKTNTVERFWRSSYAIGLELKKQGHATMTDKYGVSASDYAAHGGSFPLAVATAGVIGSVTVSGLPQRQDHELVVEALCAHLGRDYRDLALPPPALP